MEAQISTVVQRYVINKSNYLVVGRQMADSLTSLSLHSELGL